MDMRTPPLKSMILLESNPPKSRILVRIMAIDTPASLGLCSGKQGQIARKPSRLPPCGGRKPKFGGCRALWLRTNGVNTNIIFAVTPLVRTPFVPFRNLMAAEPWRSSSRPSRGGRGRAGAGRPPAGRSGAAGRPS